MTNQTTPNNSYLSYTEEMKDRISKIQRPILENDEEYQRTQLGGTSAILNDLIYECAATIGRMGMLDPSCTEIDPEDGSKQFTDEFLSEYKAHMTGKFCECVSEVIAGMQASAVNYVGLVLEGKMEPIYDGSLDGEEQRNECRKSASQLCSDVGMELAKAGVLDETADGKMKLKDNYRLFNNVGEK